jgi:hypothetical protein
VPCAAGTFAGTAGATSCTACADGTYAAGNAAACTDCGNCDDSDSCTTDSCDPTSGCKHDAIAGCTNGAHKDGGTGSGASGCDYGSSHATPIGLILLALLIFFARRRVWS